MRERIDVERELVDLVDMDMDEFRVVRNAVSEMLDRLDDEELSTLVGSSRQEVSNLKRRLDVAQVALRKAGLLTPVPEEVRRSEAYQRLLAKLRESDPDSPYLT